VIERILQALLRPVGPREFAIELWDGRVLPPDPGRQARFTASLRDPAVIRRLALRPSMVTLGEAYAQGELDIYGDLLAAYGIADRLVNADPSLVRSALHAWATRPSTTALLRRGNGAVGRLRAASLRGDDGSKRRAREAVNFHYDLPFEFFRIWLDPRMIYSCAYFATPGDTLDTAQEAKLDHVCKKLLLRPGQRFLDVGCGWGALSIHAARRYGVDATAITLSAGQAAEATRRIEAEGLGGRCRVLVADFRDLPAGERLDRIASVGMIEHVREPLQSVYFTRLFERLRPGGLALNHGITCTPSRPLRGGNVFLQRYLFPDHQLVPVSTSLRFAERAGFEVRDVEQLREHYARTLVAWFERLRGAEAEARALVGVAMVRAFEVYFIGMAHHFRQGNLQIHQSLLARPAKGDAGLPLTRAHLYCESAGEDPAHG
jgi:cyclopropane-fatty-acyl-phospholipid synthase